MPILKVTRKGHEVTRQTLDESQEIWIGRDPNNGIFLESSHGISRKHLKIFQTPNGEWKVKCESNIGGLIVESKEVEETLLEDQKTFFLHDFTFQFLIDSKETSLKKSKSQKLDLKNETFYEEEDNDVNHFKGETRSSQDSKNEYEDDSKKPPDFHKTSTHDATVVRSSTNLQTQITISIPNKEDEGPIILKNQSSWIIGRDIKCDICIENQSMSRKHLKIEKKDNKYFVTDFNSSNGTILNEEVLNSDQPYPIKSGDVLKILDVKIYFDVVNLSLKDDILELPVFSPPQNEDIQNLPPSSNVVMDETELTSFTSSSSRKRRIFYIVGLFALIFAGVYFSNKNQNTSEKTSNSPSHELSSEKETQFEELYAFAKQLYQTKKFELCLSKIEELQSIKTTEQSLDLQKKCTYGKESLVSQIEVEKQKEEQERIKSIITQNTKECTDKFSTFRSVEEIQECLTPTIDHDPENFILTELISRFEVQEIERIERQKAQASIKNKIQTEMKIYTQALELKKQGQILKAIEAYKNFLKRNHPKQIQETVVKARQELENMEIELDRQVSSFMKECDDLLVQKQYKQAHEACKKALTTLPGHSPALKGMQTAVNEINRQLKPIYEESVLNESLGRVENSKKFWNEIIEKDLPDGEYARRSRSKLKKY